MYKKLFAIFFIVISISVFSCKVSKKDNQRKIEKITVEPFSKEVIKLSDIAKTIQYIPLETMKGHTIGRVKKIFFINNRFYVIDYYKKHSIYCFDEKGRFLFEINNIGNGPGEYSFLTDVALSYDRKSLVLADIEKKKIIFFDLNGNFKYEQKIPTNLYFDSFSMHKSYNVLLAHSYLFKDAPRESEKKPSIDYASKHFKLYNYITTPSDFSDTYAGFKLHNIYTETMTLLKPFDLHNDTIYSTYAYNDTIFIVNTNEVHPKFFVDFVANSIPSKYTNAKSDEVYFKLYNDKDLKWAGLLDRLIITKNLVGFSYVTAIKNENSALYLKSTKQTITFNQIENDINNGPIGVVAGKYSDNSLIAYIDAFEVLENFDNTTNPEIQNLVNSINENDNPILILITLK
jgi:hypothetical protein